MEKRNIKSLEELYEVSKVELEERDGSIIINYAGFTVNYLNKDIIGNSLQEWLPVWFKRKGVKVVSNEKTQEFPDFFLEFEDLTHAVEVKCWNYEANPGFDLANFNSYIETLYNDSRKLLADYFVLGYVQSEHGFTVKKVYLKKIWELTSVTRNYPIGVQVKRSQPYALRPFSFHKNPDRSFKNRREFVIALKETLAMFPNPSFNFTPDQWFAQVEKNFESFTGEVL